MQLPLRKAMLLIETIQPAPVIGALISLANWKAVAEQIWDYLTKKYHPGGGIEVSLTSILIGVIIFALSLFLSRILSRLLERQMARTAHLDPGLRYTIGRLSQYMVIALGSLWALKFAFSIDLTSVAVLFTALSVGIGFGLRDIASDIAGGFILLFERPVRVGDRISIGKEQGDVHSINLRTTVITTNDRVSVIVPNSKLIRDELINWSYGDPRARIAIPVGVAYGSDVDLVTETLLKATDEVDNVLRDPPPKVQFLKFGDWSQDFRLLVWTNRPRLHTQIRSDINYRIERLFRDAGIEIPFPQTELRLRQGSLHVDTGDKLVSEDSDDREATDRPLLQDSS